LRVRGIDPDRVYTPKEIKAFKAQGLVGPTGHPVIKKLYKIGKFQADPHHGLFEVQFGGRTQVVEYEPDSDLRDTEQVPLLEDGGIEAFFRREVLPHVSDAWIDPDPTRIGYEISFTRHFYKPQKLRTLDEIRADIEALEKQTEGLLEQILVEVEGAA
jgi:type I restriction enzyme M protein